MKRVSVEAIRVAKAFVLYSEDVDRLGFYDEATEVLVDVLSSLRDMEREAGVRYAIRGHSSWDDYLRSVLTNSGAWAGGAAGASILAPEAIPAAAGIGALSGAVAGGVGTAAGDIWHNSVSGPVAKSKALASDFEQAADEAAKMLVKAGGTEPAQALLGLAQQLRGAVEKKFRPALEQTSEKYGLDPDASFMQTLQHPVSTLRRKWDLAKASTRVEMLRVAADPESQLQIPFEASPTETGRSPGGDAAGMGAASIVEKSLSPTVGPIAVAVTDSKLASQAMELIESKAFPSDQVITSIATLNGVSEERVLAAVSNAYGRSGDEIVQALSLHKKLTPTRAAIPLSQMNETAMPTTPAAEAAAVAPTASPIPTSAVEGAVAGGAEDAVAPAVTPAITKEAEQAAEKKLVKGGSMVANVGALVGFVLGDWLTSKAYDTVRNNILGQSGLLDGYANDMSQIGAAISTQLNDPQYADIGKQAAAIVSKLTAGLPQGAQPAAAGGVR